jgi:hypothetical protein
MIVVAMMGVSANAGAPPENKGDPRANPGFIDDSASKGMAAIRHAAEAQKYLFLFFYQTEDDQTRAMRPVFDATLQKVADKAEGVVINTADAAEKAVVAKFKVDRAPMPLVLVLAPNGAITGGYPLKFDEQILMGAFCSRSTWESLKALQDGKMVFLCVQNKSTKSAAEAMQAVRGVKADAKYAALTEIVMLDPSDQAEADAVKRLSIDPKLGEAMTILIAPPVTIVNRFQGAVAKDAIIAEIQKAAAGKGGCCPGSSCGPKPAAAAAQPAAKPQQSTAVKPQPGASTTPAPTKPGPAVKP